VLSLRSLTNVHELRSQKSKYLTWAEELDATNEVVAGEWWAPGTERPEISVEEDIMRGLGLELGDELEFEIGGQPLTATLTSARRVEWDSLSPNFMLVLNPAALADYPATFVASTYTPDREVMLEVLRRFPSITVVDLESVLEQVRSIMDRAALAIQYVFLFTLLAGVVVLLCPTARAFADTGQEESAAAAVLRAMHDDLERCFGRVNGIAFVIVEALVDEGGRVRRVEATGDRRAGLTTRRCIERRVARAVFPAPHGGGTSRLRTSLLFAFE
jgi:hypothetical protein